MHLRASLDRRILVLNLPRGSSARFTVTARGGVTCLCDFARTDAPLSSSHLLLLVAPMKPTVFPPPLVGFAFRFEFIRVPRKPANDHKQPVLTFDFVESLKREVSPHILRDIGVDRRRTD